MNLYRVRIWATRKTLSRPAYYEARIWAESREHAKRLALNPPGGEPFIWTPVPVPIKGN